jgi:hypothetical protein
MQMLTLAPIEEHIRVRRRDMDAALISLAGDQPKLQSFAAEQDRRRLTRAAAKGLVRLMAIWGVGNAQASALAGVSESTWDRMKAGRWDGVMSQDQLTRASALIGIFKALRLLFADGMADRWPTLANRGVLFGTMSPVEAMIDGGIPRMLEIRQYIDALRGGL